MHTSVPKVGILDVVKYLWKAARPQKWSLYFTLFAYTTGAILSVIVPIQYKKFFDILSDSTNKVEDSQDLVGIIFMVLFIHIVNWALFRTGMLALNNLESKSMARIRQISFDYMIKHSYSFFSNNFSGALIQRVGRFARSFERLYDTIIFNMIPLVVNVIGALIVIYSQQPLIAYTMMIWIFSILAFAFFFSRWKQPYDLASARADSTTTAVLSDSVSNQNTIMSFAKFGEESKFFRDTTESHAKTQRTTWNLNSITDAFQSGLMLAIEFFIFYYAIKYWQTGLFTVGTFVLIQTYIIGLGHRLWDFSRIIRNFYEGFADSKEMVEILETPYDVQDIPTATELMVTKGEINFHNVEFAFNETRTILDKINLGIKPGEKVALIGPSGAGKSTIVKLLLRMYDVTSGSIMLDGVDIRTVTQDSLRRNISLVPQDPILFHRTLMENIRYGREDATDDEVIQAARLAHCDEFIENLPLKYDTYVGERGVKLSGGERQRVAIARAILKNAPILILDEATSSLDSHSEAMIQDALDKLMEGKTAIVIAHRLSTIRKMDRIIVIEDGKVLEEGSHDELLKSDNSLYKKLWSLQAGGFLQDG